jgi:methyl-accepting chemotaxis protein
MEEKKSIFNLFTKILLAMLTVSIVPVLGVWFFNYQSATDNSSRQVEERLSTYAVNLSREVDGWLDTNRRMLTQNAALSDIRNMSNLQQDPVLKSITGVYGWTYLAFTVAPDGTNIGRSDGNPTTFYGDRDYFQQVIKGQPFGKQVLIGRTSNRPALILSTAIRSDNQQLRGVLAIAMHLDDISRSVANARIGTSGFAFLLDEVGQVIAHPSDEFTSTRKDLSDHPAFQATERSAGSVIFEDERGEKTIAFTHRTEDGWVVVAQQPYAEAYAALADLNRNSFVLLLVAVVMGFIAALLFSRQLSLPIRQLTGVADSLSRGQMGVTVSGVGRGDEIGALARAIDRLGTSIKYAMERARKAKQGNS